MRTVLLLVLLAPTLAAQDRTTAAPIDGRVGQFRYAYHFDHNALRDCLHIGGVLIALTDSGNLLRFDAATLKMTGQEVVRGRGIAIAPGANGRVLVGTRAGRVWEVDPATLAAELLFETPGEVMWLGSGAGMIVAAVDGRADPWPWPGEKDEHFMARWRRLEVARGKGLSVVVSQNGRQRVIPFAQTDIATPSAFLLDAGARLWMGTDKGEWGGEYAELDLRNGKIKTVKTDLGVLGFLRAADRRVLVYGGTSHMGFDHGFIGRVDGGRLENLRQFGSRPDWAAAPPEIAKILGGRLAGEPDAPIDFMLEDGEAGTFWVLSAHTLYRASGDFSNWIKVADLRARWVAGRAYSMGSTPTVRSLVAGPRTKELIAVMRLDGLARIVGGKVEPVAFDSEIEAPIIEVWNTQIGTVFVMADSLHAAWRLTDGRWQRLEFCAAHDGMGWYDAGPLAADSSGIIGFCAEGSAPGMRDLTRVRAEGATEVLRTWKEQRGYLDRWFLEKLGGRLFRSLGDELEVWDGKAWQRAGHLVEPSPADTKSVLYGRQFVPLGKAAGAAVYFDAQWGELARLADGPGGVELAPLAGAAAHGLTNVFDAVADRDGWVLMAAVKGLFRFRLEGSDVERIPGPKTNEELRSLCRDAQGRLWTAGDGLYVSADEGQHWEAADLPILGRTYTKRVRANPADARGIILALYDRGVVFVGR
ncbi:MAG: hypothetical protein ABSH46_04800 [Bryobacteraceae bacterium]|jgi:hypothetical protein